MVGIHPEFDGGTDDAWFACILDAVVIRIIPEAVADTGRRDRGIRRRRGRRRCIGWWHRCIRWCVCRRIRRRGVFVAVFVAVGGTGVLVAVNVGVAVGGTGVFVGVAVGGTGVFVTVGVLVGGTGVLVGVFVGVFVGVLVAVGGTGVFVGVLVDIAVGVAVADEQFVKPTPAVVSNGS